MSEDFHFFNVQEMSIALDGPVQEETRPVVDFLSGLKLEGSGRFYFSRRTAQLLGLGWLFDYREKRQMRRLKRRAARFDCRWRERRHRELRAILKKLNAYLGKTPFCVAELKLAYVKLIRCGCVSLDNPEDANFIRERCGLPPLTLEDLH